MTIEELKTLAENANEEDAYINLNYNNFMTAKNSPWFTDEDFIYKFCGLAMNQIHSLRDDEVYITKEQMPIT